MIHTGATTDICELAELTILHFKRLTTFDQPISPKPSTMLCFLQPPPAWPVPWLSHHWDGPITKWIPPPDSRWIKPRSWRIRFRLATVFRNERDAVRHYVDTRSWTPALQVEPALSDDVSSTDFGKEVDRFWSFARPILSFYFKQFSMLTERTDYDLRQITENYWPSRAEDSSADRSHKEPGRYSIRELLSSSLGHFVRSEIDGGMLHGAIHAYVSAQDEVIESAITSHCGGIERILEAFENSRGLTRNVLTDKAEVSEYRSAQKQFKRIVGDAPMLRRNTPATQAKRAAIGRHLSMQPMLTLQDRIERMSKLFERHWHAHEKVLLADLDGMIRIRNDIVHGRRVGRHNIDRLFGERVRSEALFEKLFLCLVGCPSKAISAKAAMTLEDLERNARSD